MPHLALLGDSIFDNAPYVRGGPAVIDHLGAQLPAGWRASLLAVDGSTTLALPRQLARLPGDVSHLIVSVGGNNALEQITIVDEPVASVAQALLRLADLRQQFDREYRAMLRAVLGAGRPTAVCTIYEPRFPEPPMQQAATAALALFNDCILRAAAAAGLPVLELRAICTEEADYANPIEPSVAGGAKIAAGIVRLITSHRFDDRRASLYA